MMLIIEVPLANIDAMTDVNIEKSGLYTITGDPTVVALPLPSPSHLLSPVQPNKKPGDSFSALVAFYLVIIPNDLSAEQVRSLSDVEKLGGKIITTRSTTAEFTVPQ
jgi:hypothetical protein